MFLPLGLFTISMYLLIFFGLMSLEAKLVHVLQEGGGDAGWLNEKGRDFANALHSMVWFCNTGELTNFQCILIVVPITVALSPFVVFGTWVAAYSYADHSPAEVVLLVRRIYRFVFACVHGFKFQLPSFDFSLDSVHDAIGTLVATATNFSLYMPSDFIIASRALTTVNFMLSLLKPLINGIASLLAAGECIASTNISFADIASSSDHDAIVDTVMAVLSQDGRTGGASTGDFVMVLKEARIKTGPVRPEELGTFVKDDRTGRPFEVQALWGVRRFSIKRSSRYHPGDIRKATDDEIETLTEDLRAKYRLKRTGGASIDGFVMVLPEAKMKHGHVQPGEFGKFVHQSVFDDQPYSAQALWGNAEKSDSFLSFDIRKATEDEEAHVRRLAEEYEAKYRVKGDTGGAAIGELVLVVPQAKKRDGKVKPGEFGKFVEKKDNSTLIIETLSHDSKEKNEKDDYPVGDIRKATDDENLVLVAKGNKRSSSAKIAPVEYTV